MNLGHGAVDAPAGPHLSPVEDVLALDIGESSHTFISVQTEITEYLCGCQGRNGAENHEDRARWGIGKGKEGMNGRPSSGKREFEFPQARQADTSVAHRVGSVTGRLETGD